LIQYIIGGVFIATAIFAPAWADYAGFNFVAGMAFIAWGLFTQPDKN
jgi:hypothetical protein